jgi:hypothetical protein
MPSHPSDYLGFIALRQGDTVPILSDARGEASPSDAGESSSSGGVIFKQRGSMPSLEEVLTAHGVVFAVLERPSPANRELGQPTEPGPRYTDEDDSEALDPIPTAGRVELTKDGSVADDAPTSAAHRAAGRHRSAAARDLVPDDERVGERLAVLVAAAVVTCIATTGTVLLVLGLRDRPTHPDPISALVLLLVGLSLIVTLITALRRWPGRRS